MPKERRSSCCRCGASPYSRYNSNNNRSAHKSPSQPVINETECEEARCPICMEHPHNAVLLLCSSHEKGCRPYMCDTSSRHSNCLDQFRKSTKLICPLCRGQVNGWTVVNPARQFMNTKTRNCSLGTCDYAGNYSELRKHARRVHPCVKPTDVDPERELEWRILQEDIQQQDMLSMQFESVDDDDDDANEFMDLASPIWDTDYAIFLRSFESDIENLMSVIDSGSDDASSLFGDWDSMFDFPSAGELELDIIESNMSRENAQSARSRTTTRVGQRSNGQPSSRVGQRSNGQPSSRNRQGRSP